MSLAFMVSTCHITTLQVTGRPFRTFTDTDRPLWMRK